MIDLEEDFTLMSFSFSSLITDKLLKKELELFITLDSS